MSFAGSRESREGSRASHNTFREKSCSRQTVKTEDTDGKVQSKAKIEDQMNNENLEMLQKIFENADEDKGGGLDIEEFANAMKQAFGLSEAIDNRQLETMFMKVDTNCDGTVDWEEFVSYMLLENQQKDSMSKDIIDLPFPNPAKEIPSPHHDALARIAYLPSLGIAQRGSLAETADDTEGSNGRYITCSKDGLIVFWGIDLQQQKTVNLEEINACANKTKNIWVTDMLCLANVKKIAVSTTERDVTFYDCSANNFEKQFVVSGLDHCVICMDYWYHPRDHNQARLLLGDVGGSVACITFNQATVGLFDAGIGKQQSTVTFRIIPFPELLCGRHPNVRAVSFPNLHEDWVRKVKYIPNLHCFVSCANTSQTSLYLGDLQRKKMTTYFKIRKGVYTFDYDKENNVIVSGGLDRYIRLWNPYVTSKATSVLKGHNSSVIQIIATGEQILSLSKDKVIKVWDVRDHCCIQTIPSHLVDVGAHQVTTMLYNPKTQMLLLGSNTLSVLEKKSHYESSSPDDEATTHTRPLCGALYNELFGQVVSADHGSVVNVWQIDTGEKVIMFTRAHDCDEITAMSFDPTRRRLITGSRNGSVKIWNFNNGACLRELQASDDREVTGIICPKQRIVTVGWNRKITVYRDVRGAEDELPKRMDNIHKDDILSVDCSPNGLMVTASYDGQVTSWNIDSGQFYTQFNVNDLLAGSRPPSQQPVKQAKPRGSIAHSPRKRSRASPQFVRNTSGRMGSGSRSSSRNWEMPTTASPRSSPTSNVECHPNTRSRRATTDFTLDDINKHLSVDKVLILHAREQHKETATLLVSVGGRIQAWSLHGGMLGAFEATTNTEDESVLAMTVDKQNSTLFTGDSIGYIKIWDISNYCIKAAAKVVKPDKVLSPLSAFHQSKSPSALSHLLKNRSSVGSIETASNSSRGSHRKNSPSKSETSFEVTNRPNNLCSFRAHCRSIVSVEFADDKQLIISASTDCCVRLWTVNGKYIGTFGQKQLWTTTDESKQSNRRAKRIPTDLLRVASAQTLKVVQGVAPKWKLARNIMTILSFGRRLTRANVKHDNDEESNDASTDGRAEMTSNDSREPLTDILGKNYKAKQRHRMAPDIRPTINQLQCVAFTSLPVSELTPIEEPRMPSVLQQGVTSRQQQQRILSPAPNEKPKINGRKGITSPSQNLRSLIQGRLLPGLQPRKN